MNFFVAAGRKLRATLAGMFGCRLLSAIFMGIMSALMMGCAMSPEQQVVKRIHRAAFLPSAKFVEAKVLAETLGVGLGYHPDGSGSWQLESGILMVGAESWIEARPPPRDNVNFRNAPDFLEELRTKFGVDTARAMITVKLDIDPERHCMSPGDIESVFGMNYRQSVVDSSSAHPPSFDADKVFRHRGRPLAAMIYTLHAGPLRQVMFRFSYSKCALGVTMTENQPELF